MQEYLDCFPRKVDSELDITYCFLSRCCHSESPFPSSLHHDLLPLPRFVFVSLQSPRRFRWFDSHRGNGENQSKTEMQFSPFEASPTERIRNVRAGCQSGASSYASFRSTKSKHYGLHLLVSPFFKVKSSTSLPKLVHLYCSALLTSFQHL